ncbi:MAG: hypothetical protein ABEJ28_01810, partial [Salinigranum sp.]
MTTRISKDDEGRFADAGGNGTPTGAFDGERRDDPNYRDLASDLRAALAGDVAFDEYAQVLYATDGSVYSARPAGVVCPRD